MKERRPSGIYNSYPKTYVIPLSVSFSPSLPIYLPTSLCIYRLICLSINYFFSTLNFNISLLFYIISSFFHYFYIIFLTFAYTFVLSYILSQCLNSFSLIFSFILLFFLPLSLALFSYLSNHASLFRAPNSVDFQNIIPFTFLFSFFFLYLSVYFSPSLSRF